MESNTEVKEYEETIKRLFKLLKRVCQERDEARDQLQFLLRNFHYPSIKNTEVSDIISKSLSNCSYDDLSYEKHSSTRYFPQTRSASRDDDNASVVINKLVRGKPLPQKGRLLQTVTEAGPLLQTLVVTPLPRWKNPPCPSSSFVNSIIADCKGNNNDVNSSNGVIIPTSLSLAFPTGNSSGGASQGWSASGSGSAGSGLSVKNEPMSHADMESNRIHNHHILMGKKRKLF